MFLLRELDNSPVFLFEAVSDVYRMSEKPLISEKNVGENLVLLRARANFGLSSLLNFNLRG